MTIIEAIEIVVNLIAQDLIFESHTEKDIENYIKQFHFEEME